MLVLFPDMKYTHILTQQQAQKHNATLLGVLQQKKVSHNHSPVTIRFWLEVKKL